MTRVSASTPFRSMRAPLAAVAWLQHGQKARPPGQARGCGVGFDRGEVALLSLDPIELVADAELGAQLVQLLAGYLALAVWQGRIFALHLRDPASDVLSRHGVGESVAHRRSPSS